MDPMDEDAGAGASDAAVEPSDVLANFDMAAAHRSIFALLVSLSTLSAGREHADYAC
eukprot:SAG11_NODE_121_length_15851_cov_6.082466_10_plen_57_part_00